TRRALGRIPRLIDMGVETFLISSTLQAVLGQRLLRRVCPECRSTYRPGDSLLAELNLSRDDIGQRHFHYGKGCSACNHTGYKGRIGVYEMMRIDDSIRTLINEHAPAVILREKAIELGMITLRQDGIRAVFEGHTTVEEVLRYT